MQARAYDDAPHGGYPDPGGRGGRPAGTGWAGTGEGRRSRRHRSSDDDYDSDYDSEPRRHGAPEPDRYAPEPQVRPLEQGDWRDPARSYDDYGRW